MTNLMLPKSALEFLKTEKPVKLSDFRFAVPEGDVIFVMFPDPKEIGVVLYEPSKISLMGALIDAHDKHRIPFRCTHEGVTFHPDVHSLLGPLAYGFVHIAVVAAHIFATTKQTGKPKMMSGGARKTARSAGVRGETYRLLDLSAPPITYLPESGDKCRETGIHQRWHMRRGHWRHYRDGRKVWVKAYYAGDKKIGIVHKDYAL